MKYLLYFTPMLLYIRITKLEIRKNIRIITISFIELFIVKIFINLVVVMDTCCVFLKINRLDCYNKFKCYTYLCIEMLPKNKSIDEYCLLVVLAISH